MVMQNEVQSAHWGHDQATLFTAHAWIITSANREDSIHESIVIISDCLEHTKFAVYSFMQYIFTYLKKQHPQITKIDVFSDGAASQFKQKYLFSNLHKWEEAHGIKLRWNFFATSQRI
jgi:hypothetical protein